MGEAGGPTFTQEGSILKITMKNFMTYKHETIYPGPNFNVVVGPNGSGKSSIVTALSICLGGELRSLNRQADLHSLINNDCGNEAAIIEIELFSKKGTNTTVKAVIKKERVEPGWSINNKDVSRDKLMKLMEKLQIQPGNLCQFLPQDVVREFPQMKAPQIFENTIKAVGDQEMLEKKYRGEKIQEELEEIANTLKTKRNTVSSNEQKERKLETDRLNLEQLEKLQDKKATIEKALLWEKFKTLRKVVKETRDNKRRLDEKEAKVKEQLEPIRTFLQEYHENVDKIKAAIDVVEKEGRQKMCEVEEFDITKLEDDLDKLVQKEQDLTTDENNRIQKKEKTITEIAELQSFIRENPLDPGLEENLRKLKEDRLRREDQLRQKEDAKQQIEMEITHNRRDIGKLTQQMNSLKNMKSRKLSVLEKENPDAYNGVMWLRQNQDRFKHPVHEPIMLCLDVREKDFARYLETAIGRADLEGFVCEDPDDVNLLLKELREVKKLRKINVFHSDPKPKEHFRKPYTAEDLEKYGFRTYLSEMYDAPTAVNAYLCQQKMLHQVPLFWNETHATDQLKEKFFWYYISNHKFNTKRSKYSNELSTGIEDIGSRRVIRLADNIDKSRMEEVERELAEKSKNLKYNEARLKNQEDTMEKLKASLKEVSGKSQVLENKRKEYNSKVQDLKYKEQYLKDLQEPKCNIEEEKKNIKQKKSELVKELSRMVGENLERTRACTKLDLQRRSKLLQLQNVESENQENSDKQKELEKEMAETARELKECNDKFNVEKNQLTDTHDKASKATGGVLSPDQKTKPPLEWQRKFDALDPGADENVLNALLEDCENDIKKKKVNPDTIRKIKEIKESLEKARAEVEELEKSQEKKTQELDQLRKGWIHGVRRLVGQVGDKFSEMMARLGFAGQIELQEGTTGGDLDLKNYGIKISVKFRSGDEFDELTKGTQSGGEKSVTTAVYMMALQGLTQVPFRCVDEINQGMDETNERRVWDMLLEVCREHQAQYFYMAPKFPYNLPFDDQVTILICNSGSSKKKSPSDFSTQTFVERSRNLFSRST